MTIYAFDGFIPVVHESAFVHPQATVTGNVVIGKDVYIGPGAAIRGDWGGIVIEDGCNVQENCTIHMFPGVTVVLEAGEGKPGFRWVQTGLRLSGDVEQDRLADAMIARLPRTPPGAAEAPNKI